ncbi:MAG: type II CAAX endopeptidase family protein [Alphaproteobacteria bacterium]
MVIALAGGALFAALLAAIAAAWASFGERPGLLLELLRDPLRNWELVSAYKALSVLAVEFGFLAVWLFAVWIALLVVHRRPLRTALTGARRFRWGLFATSFAILLALLLAGLGIQVAIWPDELELVFDPGRFVVMLPWVAGMLVLQVLAEEVVFRGYLLQALRLLLPRWVVWFAVSALFALAHGLNPEASSDYAFLFLFFVMGGYLTFLPFYSNGLETAFGAHLANNVMALLVVGNPLSNFPTSTVFWAPAPGVLESLVSISVVLALHFALLHLLARRG